MVFITSHLLPNASNYEKRCLQYKYGKACAFDDVSGNSDENNNVIWLGDFNWRVDQLTSQEMIMYVFELSSFFFEVFFFDLYIISYEKITFLFLVIVVVGRY